MKSCLLCGVGGQGTVLASRILAQAAMDQGLFARTAETIGMAQRGGCVVSHVRFGTPEEVASPLIPPGKADVIIGFEPGEAVRCLPYLKKDGVVVVCKKTIPPVTASLSGKNYDAEPLLDYLRGKVRRCIIVDGEAICRACGSEKVLNVALVGAVIKSGVLELDLPHVERVISERVKARFVEMNQKALQAGYEVIA